jgi:hypothetical protein
LIDAHKTQINFRLLITPTFKPRLLSFKGRIETEIAAAEGPFAKEIVKNKWVLVLGSTAKDVEVRLLSPSYFSPSNLIELHSPAGRRPLNVIEVKID